MSLGAKMSSDILVTMLFKVSLKVRGLVFIPLLTISLGVADYGAFVQVNAIASLMALVCLLGYDSGFVRFVHETDQEGGLFASLTLITFIASVIGGIIIIVGANLLAQYTLQSTAYTTLFILGGVYVVAHSMFQLARAYYRASRRIKLYSLIEAIDVYLSVGMVAAVVLLFEGSVEHAFFALVAVHLVITATMFIEIWHHGGLALPIRNQVIACTRFSIGAMGSIVSGSLLHKIDRVLIGFFLGASAVGIYSVAYSIGQIIKLFYQPINISFFPEFSKLWTDREYDSIRNYMRLGIRYAAIIGVPSVSGFAIVGEELIGLLSTAEVATEGYIPLLLISGAILIRGIGSFYTNLFYAKGTSRIPFIVQTATVFVNAGLNLLLIPIFGITGAAFTTLISFAGAAVVVAALWQRHLVVLPHWGQIGQVLLASGCMLIAFSLVSLPWPLVIATAPIVYFGVFIGTGGLEKRELRIAMQVLR